MNQGCIIEHLIGKQAEFRIHSSVTSLFHKIMWRHNFQRNAKPKNNQCVECSKQPDNTYAHAYASALLAIGVKLVRPGWRYSTAASILQNIIQTPNISVNYGIWWRLFTNNTEVKERIHLTGGRGGRGQHLGMAQWMERKKAQQWESSTELGWPGTEPQPPEY
jgi:hypothetical protein